MSYIGSYPPPPPPTSPLLHLPEASGCSLEFIIPLSRAIVGHTLYWVLALYRAISHILDWVQPLSRVIGCTLDLVLHLSRAISSTIDLVLSLSRAYNWLYTKFGLTCTFSHDYWPYT